MPWIRGPFVVALVASSLAAGRDAIAQPAAKAYVLDSGMKALVALELPSGRRLGSLPLTGAPWALLRSPDGSRLVVLDRGPGQDKHERGYQASGKSSATIVDPEKLQLVGRVELGFGIKGGRWYFSPDGRRLTVLCPGYEAKSPAEALVRELVNVDLAGGRESGRLTLDAGAVPIAASKDGRTLPLIQGLPRGHKFPYPQSRLFIVDLAGPSLRASLDLAGWHSLYTDGAYFYLVDPGRPDENPQKNRNGLLQIASLERGALTGSLDAGRKPCGFLPDEARGQVFLASDGTLGAAQGDLHVLRGAELVATLKVAAYPKLLARRRDSVYVVGEKAVTVVDPARLRVAATIPLALGNEGLVDDHDLPTELKVSPDGKRAFALYAFQGKVITLDLEAHEAIGLTKTGRGGKKFLGYTMNLMFGRLGLLAAGYSTGIHAAPSMLAVRPDGRYAYAINAWTKDVTVVDGVTGKSVEMIGGGGYALEMLRGGRFLYEVSGSELRLIDLERNQKTAETPLPDLRGLFFSPDRTLAVALAKQVVLVLDGTTGKELARLEDFSSPNAIAFDEPRVEGGAGPPPGP
jgi:DNA-binding beta-propeller fold protein YncE